MANQRMSYEDRSYPKKKVNRTIIFINSAKRKNTSAVTNHRSVLSQQSEPQSQIFQEEHTAPCTSKHLSQPERSAVNITLMDSTNASNNTISSNHAVNTEINEPTTPFLFNFGSTNAESRNKKPYVPNKLRGLPNKENGLPPTNQSNAPSSEEFCDANSDFNTASKNEISIQDEGDLSIPNAASTKSNQKLNLNVFKRYENIDINSIYPERLESLFPPFGIQQRFGGVWYCLICNIKSLTFRTLKQHVESEKHGNASETKRLKLNSYIDFWAAQPDDCKKYQIAFNINNSDKDILKCGKCSQNVTDNNYTNHMLICKPKKKKYPKQKKTKFARQNDSNANNNSKDSNIASIESRNKNTDEVTDNSNNVNEPTARVEDSAAGSSKKKRETKKKPLPKSHEVTSRIASLKWSRIIDGLSTRFDRHYRFLTKCSDDIIQCLACEMDVELDIVQLIVHISSKEHHKMCGLFKNFWMYTCFVCDVEFSSESEFWCHRNLGDTHKEKVEQIPADRHKSLGEYECYSCKLIMFGDAVNVTAHVEAPVIGRKTKYITPVPTELDQAVIDLFNSSDCIESIALELLDGVKEAQEQEYQVEEIIVDLEKTLRPCFPKVKAYPFGSRITGICNKASDLDVYVDTESNYHGEKSVRRTNVIQEMKRSLADSKQIWDDIFTIPAARTPIIQLRHIPTDIDIDLSFQNGLSVENTKFLRWCMDLQPKLRPLILLLKLFITTAKFKLHITTYALCMMAIFKMQIDGHLIPVTYLQHLNEAAMTDVTGDKKQFVTGWSIIDYRLSVEELQGYTVPVTCDVFELLKDFFQYYASFDYNKMICPLMGEVINMDEWFEDNVSILPDAMAVYKEKVYNGLLRHTVFGYRFPLTVQDPFDMSHNLTKSINKSDLKVWKANCQLIFDYLTKL